MKLLKSMSALALLSLMSPVLSAGVNINTADSVALADGLKGVGLRLAESIITYRETNGRYWAVEDLVQVKGIGARVVEDNRDVVEVWIEPEEQDITDFSGEIMPIPIYEGY
ncbi:MAG: helix-hairpin-helix domain-containing protein [Arenicellales bacterium]|nr:helix-hairpin-helix domain-containing protein [Arenicellales bacterium]